MKDDLRTIFNNRQYMLSSNFEIFYYSDTNIKNVDDHVHDYYEFYFFIDGLVSININGKDYQLTSGDMIIIPPNVIHRVNILDQSTAYQRFVLWMTKDYYQALLNLSPDYGYILQESTRQNTYVYHYDMVTFNLLKSKVFHLIEEIHFDRFAKMAQISLCISDLILSLNRTIYEMHHPNVPNERQSLYQNLITYIENHITEDLSLDFLAQEFYVSKYYISHIFKQNMGLSLYQYILKKRLAMCRNAIISNTKISEAYLQCGFKDYSSFYRAFKKEYGFAPSEYQELYAHKPLG